MKKLFIALAFTAAFAFGSDSTVMYYRGSSHIEHGSLMVNYIQPVIGDTLTTIVVPGSSLPYTISVKDGVVENNSTMVFFRKDTANATEEPSDKND